MPLGQTNIMPLLRGPYLQQFAATGSGGGVGAPGLPGTDGNNQLNAGELGGLLGLIARDEPKPTWNGGPVPGLEEIYMQPFGGQQYSQPLFPQERTSAVGGMLGLAGGSR